jgi:hypothetical protein
MVDELRQVLVVQAAMPAAMTPIMLARLYGGRPAIAVQVVLATTIGSIVTLPWIIYWGIHWVGLKPLFRLRHRKLHPQCKAIVHLAKKLSISRKPTCALHCLRVRPNVLFTHEKPFATVSHARGVS